MCTPEIHDGGVGTQDYAERRALRSELRSLSKEEKQRQQKAVQEVLKHASVVCATLTGVATFQLRDLTFHVTVVDEAAQVSTGPACLVGGCAGLESGECRVLYSFRRQLC